MASIDIPGGDFHAVILVAKHASSRAALAEAVIGGMIKRSGLEKRSVRLERLIPGEKGLGIDEIRRLYQSTSYRQSGRKLQIVVIADAQTMTVPAQNAFLKLLEEPPAGVRFVLTCPHPQSLIATIRSRCQLIRWRPLSLAQFRREFSQLDEAGQTRLFYLSDGDTIEAARLLELAGGDPADQPIRQLMTEPLGSAVINLQALAGDRGQARVVVEQLTRLAHAGLRHAPRDKKPVWLKRLKAALKAQERLASQTNVKLLLDGLLLEFRA